MPTKTEKIAHLAAAMNADVDAATLLTKLGNNDCLNAQEARVYRAMRLLETDTIVNNNMVHSMWS
jgi:hypothetical protein